MEIIMQEPNNEFEPTVITQQIQLIKVYTFNDKKYVDGNVLVSLLNDKKIKRFTNEQFYLYEVSDEFLNDFIRKNNANIRFQLDTHELDLDDLPLIQDISYLKERARILSSLPVEERATILKLESSLHEMDDETFFQEKTVNALNSLISSSSATLNDNSKSSKKRDYAWLIQKIISYEKFARENGMKKDFNVTRK